MKKPKFSLGQGGLQGFFLQHVEKVVLAIVLLIVAFYLYSGYSLEGYKSDKTPVDLKFTTISAHDTMEKDTSDILAQEAPRKPVTDYKERADEGRKESSANNYPIGAINIPSFPPRYKRHDPKVHEPENILARAFLASVYVQTPGEEDPFRNDGDAAPAKSNKPQSGKSGKGKDDAGAFPGLGAGMGGPPGAPAGRPGSGKSGDKNKEKDKGKGAGGPSDAFPGAAFPGAAGGDEAGFGGGAAGAGMQGGGTVSEAHRKKYIYWTPSGGGPGANAPGGDSVSVVGKTQYIVSILATFPYEKQFDEYQRVFADAEGNDPLRDMPRFERVIVERSEITADPKAEPVWTRVIISKKFKNSWVEPTMPEVAEDQYTDPALTIAMPPAVMIDPIQLGSHPLIPRTAASAAEDAGKAAKGPATDETEEGDDDFSGERSRRGAGGPADGMGPGIGGGRPNPGAGMAGERGSRPPAGGMGGEMGNQGTLPAKKHGNIPL